MDAAVKPWGQTRMERLMSAVEALAGAAAGGRNGVIRAKDRLRKAAQ